MTFDAVQVLLAWAQEATKKQQVYMAREIDRFHKVNPSKIITSYEINAFANEILLTKVA